MVWTVNQPQHMMEAVRCEVDAILTDVTKTWLDLRSALQSEFHLRRSYVFLMFFQGDYDKIGSQYGRGFLWTTLGFYTPFVLARGRRRMRYLVKVAGPFM